MLTKSQIKNIKKLHSRKGRCEEQLFICEGERIVQECKNADSQRFCCSAECTIIATEKFAGKYENIEIVPQHIFEQISETKTPQGIMAICPIPKALTWADFEQFDKILICDGISDPGNLGTIIRTAEAAGIEGVVLLNCADVYSGKVVRSTMGAIFRMPILIVPEQVGKFNIEKQNRQIVSLALENAENLFEIEFEKRVALIVGSEAFGIRKEILQISDKIAKIPQKSGESLNAAVAAGIAIFRVLL